MALVKRHTPGTSVDVADRLFGQWPEFFRRPIFMWPDILEDVLRVDEYQEDGTRVIKAEMPGIDPEKDVELTVSEGMLHIHAERREEEEAKEKEYTRHELRYGSFNRDLVLPEGCSESDVTATYKDGILEIRVPMPTAEAKKAAAKRIPIAKA